MIDFDEINNAIAAQTKNKGEVVYGLYLKQKTMKYTLIVTADVTTD